MDLLYMDGHGIYVWSIYAIGFVLLALAGTYPWLHLRRVRRQVKNDEKSA